ncbi:MAG: enoyl-CoA hydratase/isomerase family protein [Mycobacteriaceae bacterium]|nr:enoyl-CoA hydratase/isomerase family protein [Mycobacteriaceae bacterium]
MPYLERDGDVFVLYLGNRGQVDSENRLHPDWITEVHALLDEVEATEGKAALVTTSTGKYFTNGLDTDWLFANFDQSNTYLDAVHALFARLLAFPMATVAAVNGHAFGAGAMVAMSHDFRVMRSDRGYWCLPEISIGMSFPIGMNALVSQRLGNQVALEAMTTGARYGAAEALAKGIVDATAEQDQVLAAALARAAALTGTRGPNLAGVKSRLHEPVLTALAVRNTPDNLNFMPQ